MSLVKMHTEYTFEGSPAVTAVQEFDAAGEYKKDYRVSPKTNGKPFAFSVQRAIALAIVICASCRVRVTIGQQQFEIDYFHPLVWTRKSRLPCPLLADAETMTIDYLDVGDGGVVKIRVPESEGPDEPVPAAEASPAASPAGLALQG